MAETDSCGAACESPLPTQETVALAAWSAAEESATLWAELKSLSARLYRGWRRRTVAYYVYRYRYLGCFAVIGFLSIVLELGVLAWLPAAWPRPVRVVSAFSIGLAFSLILNVKANFQVPRRYLRQTSLWFAGISIASFAANLTLVEWLHATTELTYGWLRLGISGALFLAAYALHRRFTFAQSRNFGIAVYAAETEDVGRIFERVGHSCDHIHVDLVDATVKPTAAPVNLSRIEEARQYWRGYPVCLHLMSRRPRAWLDATWHLVDWVLLPCDMDEDLEELIFECRSKRKRVGVVWHQSAPPSRLLPILPHVDFVMVLGIAEPGKSGQTLSPQGLAVAETLESMRRNYRYELMFDGGVKTTNIAAIPGRYIVSASAVLDAPEPADAAHYLQKSLYRSPARQAA